MYTYPGFVPDRKIMLLFFNSKQDLNIDNFFFLQILENLGKAELHISRFMSLRKKFVYDLNIAECEEQEDALAEMER